MESIRYRSVTSTKNPHDKISNITILFKGPLFLIRYTTKLSQRISSKILEITGNKILTTLLMLKDNLKLLQYFNMKQAISESDYIHSRNEKKLPII